MNKIVFIVVFRERRKSSRYIANEKAKIMEKRNSCQEIYSNLRMQQLWRRKS